MFVLITSICRLKLALLFVVVYNNYCISYVIYNLFIGNSHQH